MQLAAWQAARNESNRAILAPYKVFMRTTPDGVGGSGSSGPGSAARLGTSTGLSGKPVDSNPECRCYNLLCREIFSSWAMLSILK
eukprot:8146054-Pyramimonas_sp.AAC.1